jgi:hypothetical protein
MLIFQCLLPVFIYFTVFYTVSSAAPQIPLFERGAGNEPGTVAMFVESFRKASAMRPRRYRLYIQKTHLWNSQSFVWLRTGPYLHMYIYGPQGLIYKQLNSWGSGFVVPCYVKNIDKCPPPPSKHAPASLFNSTLLL